MCLWLSSRSRCCDRLARRCGRPWHVHPSAALLPACPPAQGAVRQFVLFFGGLGVAMVGLKSMDRLLYSLEET